MIYHTKESSGKSNIITGMVLQKVTKNELFMQWYTFTASHLLSLADFGSKDNMEKLLVTHCTLPVNFGFNKDNMGKDNMGNMGNMGKDNKGNMGKDSTGNMGEHREG